MKSIDELRSDLRNVTPESPLPTTDQIRSRARHYQRRRTITAIAATALVVLGVAVGVPLATRPTAEQDVVPAAPPGTYAEPGPQVAEPAFVPAKVDVPTTLEEALKVAGGPPALAVQPRITAQGPKVDLGDGFFAWVRPPQPGVFGLPESAMKTPPTSGEPPQVCLQLPGATESEAGCFVAELNIRGPGVVLADLNLNHLNRYFAWVVGPISSVILDFGGPQLPVKLYNLGYNTGLIISDAVQRPDPTATINMNDEDPLRNAKKLTLRAFDDTGRLVARS